MKASTHLFLSLTLCLGACAAPSVENALPDESQRQQVGWGIYMVGSDLEDDVRPRNGVSDEEETGEPSPRGAGSTDLREMIAAYQSFTPAQQQSLDLVVAFGGARKQGWQGIKYADLPCLVKDAADDYFGNADCYLYQDDSPSLSDTKPVADFLKFLKPRFANKDKRMFVMWNHGASYLGVGHDSRKESDAMVTLPQIKAALDSQQSHFDLIGFDACLMASLEVAHAVAPYADYMVASQDLEPGHGWDYTQLLNWFKTNPQADMVAFGRYMVDSFLDSPQHQKTRNKTLSLVKLDAVPGMVSAMDTLTQQLPLDKVNPISQARRRTEEYGVQNRGEVVYAMDLKNWLENLQKELPELNIQSALEQFKKLTLYSRGDAYTGVAEGLTVFSLNAKMKAAYQEPETFSRNFLSFAEQFIRVSQQDREAPTLKTENFQTQQASGEPACNGICVTVEDNQGIKKIEQMLSLAVPESQTLYAIGSRPLKELGNHRFEAENWDGEWFLLCDGPCETNLSIFPALFFAGETRQNTRLYQGEVRFNGQDALLFIEQNALNDVTNTWIVPFQAYNDSIPLLSKEQLPVEVGDTLQFYFRVVDLEQKQNRWELGDSITFTQTPNWNFAAIGAERLHHIQAEDFNGNFSVGPLYEIRDMN